MAFMADLFRDMVGAPPLLRLSWDASGLMRSAYETRLERLLEAMGTLLEEWDSGRFMT